MANEEIITALKNAIERNEDLDESSQTLINAGYSEQEVNEAKNLLQKGVLSAEIEKQDEIKKEQDIKNNSGKPSFFSFLKEKIKGIFAKKESEEGKNKSLLIAITSLILLIILLILVIIFRNSILNWFG